MNTHIENTPLNLTEQLEMTSMLELNRVPTISELEELTMKGQQERREFGIQSIVLTDGNRVTTIQRFKGTTLFEPSIPHKYKGKVSAGVFLHNHPISSEEEIPGEISLHIFPSEAGDFYAQIWSRSVGGYMNTISKFGVTLNIGIEGMSREEDVVRRLKFKSGNKETAKETNIWKFFTGKQAGNSIVSEQAQKVTEKMSLGTDEIILASHTAYVYTGFDRSKDKKVEIHPLATVRHFLFLTWDKFKQMEDNFGGLDNLIFGDGVDKLVTALDLDVSHKKNLSEVCKVHAMPPKKRGEA